MCSILLTNKAVPSSVSDSHLLVNRGPDRTSHYEQEGIHFFHYLLNVTGDVTTQPVFKNDVIAMFNGEIYNYRSHHNYSSEVEMLLDAYFEDKKYFANLLDGEFAVCITDFNRRVLTFCTDPFGTKPLYYAINGEDFGVCTYKEPLVELGFSQIVRCSPNARYELSLEDLALKLTPEVFEFNLSQHVNHFDKWTDAFLSAIKKRFFDTKYEIVLPLSSGHDSGAIACAFRELGISAISYSYRGYEHREVLADRLELRQEDKKGSTYLYTRPSPNKGETYYRLVDSDKALSQKLLRDRCAIFYYGPDLDDSNATMGGMEDIGAQGLMFLLSEVKSQHPKVRILASGQGGDEITSNNSNYGFSGQFNPTSFPSNLETIFPWQNFFLGAQSSFLLRDESISGGLGIEGRYAFLDKQVVQAFLNLKKELKNQEFKSPISHFLRQLNYPWMEGEWKQSKRGFDI